MCMSVYGFVCIQVQSVQRPEEDVWYPGVELQAILNHPL